MTEAEAYRTLQPAEYLSSFVKSGFRPDGRLFNAVRPVKVVCGVISSANGSAMVSMGNTSVVAGLKLAIGTPSSSDPRNGHVEINVHLPPLCSSRYAVGKPDERAMTAGELITSAVLGTELVDLQELCIEGGKAAWTVNVDVLCVSDDGNAVDAALLATQAALRSLRIPGVVAAPDGAYEVDGAAEPRRLTITSCVASLTFATFGDVCMVDPTAFEEESAECMFIVGRDSKGNNCICQKYGGQPVPMSTLRRAQLTCAQHVAAVAKLLHDAVALADAGSA